MELNPKIVVSSSLGLILLAYLYRTEYTSVVETAQGNVQGIVAKSRNGRQFSAFWGIPYAEPPVGDLRFQSPVPAKNWTDVLAADKYGLECLQMDFMFYSRILGQEDCLILNVFTPNDLMLSKSKFGELYPVIVFIHGGGFMSGSPKLFGPNYFMDENIVLVTINYRLGPLGFLNTGDEVIRGNMGLKDQNLALRWIQENIKYFGGDPNQVTLLGESAGAASVHYHMMSDKSKGLFHSAISSSGTALSSWAFTKDPVGQFKRVGKRLNCDTSSSTAFFQCLQKFDPVEIAQLVLINRDATVHPLDVYAPSAEKIIDDDTFLSEGPEEIYTSHKFTPVPWIMGINEADGIVFTSRIIMDEIQKKKIQNISEWYNSLPQFLSLENLSEDNVRKITKFYFNTEQDFDPLSQLENLANMFSDHFFFKQLDRMGEMYQNRTDIETPLHFYFYTYRGIFRFFKLLISAPAERILHADALAALELGKDLINENLFGAPTLPAGHADDLAIIFDMGYVFTIKSWSSAYGVSTEWIKTITNFARSRGNVVEYYGKFWPRVEQNAVKFMRVDVEEEAGLISTPFAERIDFWKSLNLKVIT